MRVLVALAQANGRLVTRETIAERCWDGRMMVMMSSTARF